MTTCETYEEYGEGVIDETRFREHASGCPTCQQLLAEDRRLLGEAVQLRPRAREGQEIWDGVEGALVRARWKRTGWRFSRIAAVIIAGLGIWQLVPVREAGGRLLLHGETLARVEKAEQAYIEAIEALSARAGTDEWAPGGELQDLLAVRLAVVDAQIARCRKAARQNPGNAQVRRYLLAALQQKEATLKQMMPQGEAEQVERTDDERG